MDPFQDLDSMFAEFGINSDQTNEQPTRVTLEIPSTDEIWQTDCGSDCELDCAKQHERKIREWTERNDEGNCDEESEDSDAEIVERGNCTCKSYCLERFRTEDISNHILSMKEIEKSEKEMFVMASLQKFGNEDTRHGKRRRLRYRFMFCGQQVCKSMFCHVNSVGKKTLRSLMEHVSSQGAVPRVHGNTGRKPHNALKYQEVKFCVEFLLSHADLHGLPMPAAPKGHDEAPPLYLPSSSTKKELHELYCSSCTEASIRQLGLSSFKGVWQNCVPHIRIMTPKEDVCHRCQLMKKEVADSVSEQEKLAATTDLRNHIENAQRERELYKLSISQGVEEISDFELPNGPVPPMTSNLQKVHYTFDYSQNVVLPHHSQQMGPLYFISGRKIQIFGVRMDSTGKQYNYLIDEDQTLDFDGKKTHGPNAVISMLHDCFFRRGLGEVGCVLHADNCGGQNKNRYVLAYLCWRIHRGLHGDITLLMQIPGHTKCLVDGGFGHIKRLFRRTDCDSLLQLAYVVDKSAHSNIPVLFRNDNGEQNWEWYDWKSFLQQYFLPVKGVQKYCSFRLTSADKDGIFVRETSMAQEKRLQIVKQGVTVPGDTYPPTIPPAGLTRERQEYMYKHVRPYVRPQFQDLTCPGMLEE